jgi:hypothetical protein
MRCCGTGKKGRFARGFVPSDPEPFPSRPIKTYLLKFAGFYPRIVSSQTPRRNNSLGDETIFSFSSRRPETFADYQ